MFCNLVKWQINYFVILCNDEVLEQAKQSGKFRKWHHFMLMHSLKPEKDNTDVISWYDDVNCASFVCLFVFFVCVYFVLLFSAQLRKLTWPPSSSLQWLLLLSSSLQSLEWWPTRRREVRGWNRKNVSLSHHHCVDDKHQLNGQNSDWKMKEASCQRELMNWKSRS